MILRSKFGGLQKGVFKAELNCKHVRPTFESRMLRKRLWEDEDAGTCNYDTVGNQRAASLAAARLASCT